MNIRSFYLIILGLGMLSLNIILLIIAIILFLDGHLATNIFYVTLLTLLLLLCLSFYSILHPLNIFLEKQYAIKKEQNNQLKHIVDELVSRNTQQKIADERVCSINTDKTISHDLKKVILDIFDNKEQYIEQLRSEIELEEYKKQLQLSNIFSQRTESIFCGRGYTRIQHALRALEIDTIEKLVSYSEDELLDMRNLGSTSVEKIKICLAKKGLKLNMSKNDIHDILTKELSETP